MTVVVDRPERRIDPLIAAGRVRDLVGFGAFEAGSSKEEPARLTIAVMSPDASHAV